MVLELFGRGATIREMISGSGLGPNPVRKLIDRERKARGGITRHELLIVIATELKRGITI